MKQHVTDDGRLRNPGRPWSVAEIEELIPALTERIEDQLEALKSAGERFVELNRDYDRHEATAVLLARKAFIGEKSAAEDRKAWATLHVFDAAEFPHGPSEWIGLTLTDIGMARDLAEHAFKLGRTVLDRLDTELKVLQSLHVSARKAP